MTKRRRFHSMLNLFHIFCSYLGHICAHHHISQTTSILFIKSITTIINGTILRCLLGVKNVCGNQLLPPLNNLKMFTRNHIAYFYLVKLFKGNKTNERQNILLHPWTLTIRSVQYKAINNLRYISSFYYCRLYPHRRHGIIIISVVVPKICCLYHINSWCNFLDPVRKYKL